MSDGRLPEWAALAIELLSWSPDLEVIPDGLKRRAQNCSAEALEVLRKRRVDSLVFLVADKETPRQRLYNKLWAEQQRVLELAISVLRGAGVPFAVFKGCEFVRKYFGKNSIGMLYDVDLLVERAHIEAVKVVLHTHGFRQAVFSPESQGLRDRDISEIARMELSHYELAPFASLSKLKLDEDELSIAKAYNEFPIWVVDDTAYVVVEVDVHHGLAMDIDGAEVFKRAVPSAFGGAVSLSPADNIWFVASRFYTEVALHSKRSIRDFVYLLSILRRETIDWDLVLRPAREYAISAPLYYYLSFLRHVSGADVPEEVLKQLLPQSNLGTRDLGWQLTPLFECAPLFPLSQLPGQRAAGSR